MVCSAVGRPNSEANRGMSSARRSNNPSIGAFKSGLQLPLPSSRLALRFAATMRPWWSSANRCSACTSRKWRARLKLSIQWSRNRSRKCAFSMSVAWLRINSRISSWLRRSSLAPSAVASSTPTMRPSASNTGAATHENSMLAAQKWSSLCTASGACSAMQVPTALVPSSASDQHAPGSNPSFSHWRWRSGSQRVSMLMPSRSLNITR